MASCAVWFWAATVPAAGAPGDWPLFNYDERNSCNPPISGRITAPAFKWRTYPEAQPLIWTGLTFSRDQGLTFLPMVPAELIKLNPLTGATARILTPPSVWSDVGTGEGIPVHADLDGDGIQELIVPFDGYGIIVYHPDGSIFWQRQLLSENGRGLSLNIVVGDLNADGQKEVLVHDDGRALRVLRCLDGRTGEELWVFNDSPGIITGSTTQNFDVWFDIENDGQMELLFQEASTPNAIFGVRFFCIRTVPTKKTMTWLNNWPNGYSLRPLNVASHVTPGGDPALGDYEIVFVDANTVTVNAGPPIAVIRAWEPVNLHVIPGLSLSFHPDSNTGDRVNISVHRSVEKVWEREFATGHCFAHFLLADFDEQSPGDEIGFGTTSRYYCIKKNGDILWTYDTGLPPIPWEDISYGGAFSDIDGDGIKEIVFNAWDELVCLNGKTGQKKWSYFCPGGDRTLCYDQENNFFRVYPLIADVDGDGEQEIITADRTQVYSFDSAGNVEWTLPFATLMPDDRVFTIDGEWINYPHRSKRWIFADIDGDGLGEIVGSYMKVRSFIETPVAPHVVFAIDDVTEVDPPSAIDAAVVRLEGGKLDFQARLGVANDVTVYFVSDLLHIRDNSGNLITNPGDGFTVISPKEVSVGAAGVTRIEAYLGDQNDRIRLTPLVTASARLFGEAGDDTLTGGAGDDELDGGPGADTIDGAAGSDRLLATADANMRATDSSLVTGGLETDAFIGIEQIQLTGGSGNNTLDASGISATSGITVRLFGDGRNDTLLGGAGDDFLSGGPGSDSLNGGAGADVMQESRDADMTLSDNSLVIGSGETDTFTSIESVVLVGGPGHNRIDLSSVAAGSSLLTRVEAGNGDDTIVGGWSVGHGGRRQRRGHFHECA